MKMINCPYCKSKVFKELDLIVDFEYVERICICGECEQTFRVVYKFDMVREG